MDISLARTVEAAASAVSAKDSLNGVLSLARAAFDPAPIAVIIACDGDVLRPLAWQGLAMSEAPLASNDPLNQYWPAHRPVEVFHGAHASLLPGAQFYAGIALVDDEQQLLGLLAVASLVPHQEPTPAQLSLLEHTAHIAASLLQHRQNLRRAAIVAQASEHVHEGIVICDAQGCVRWINAEAQRLVPALSVGQPFMDVFPSHLQENAAALTQWLSTPENSARQQLHYLTADGQTRVLEVARSHWNYEQERGYTLLLHDMTEAAQQRSKLDHLAHYDSLTGLPNRNALLAALDEHPHWGVALLAIDRFKWINDGLGHSVGDLVLQAIADRLYPYRDAATCIARVGGDVFAIACSDERFAPAGSRHADIFVRELMLVLEQPLHIHGHEVRAEISASVALRRDVQAEADLLACADLALNRAKAAGGRQLNRYVPHMRTDALARRDLDLELRRAFAHSEFEVRYQPQVELLTGRICGAEALLRWQHPTRGLVPAGEFIDMLSRSPLGVEVGRWVMQRACLDAMQWPDVTTSVSINLFPAQVDETLVDAVENALSFSGLPADRLEIEVTETTALTQEGAGARALAQLRTRGVNLAFDDFGTGYASLSTLQRFRIDRVKIDKSFVHGMLTSSEDAAIVRWIVMLARALGLRVVAEGVEDQHQADLLRGLGCDEAQGYLYAQALDAASFSERLRTQLAEDPHG